MKHAVLAILPAVAALLQGCFDEPVPASATVRPETRIYMKDGKAETFSQELLLREGMVFTAEGVWTNLSAVVETLDPGGVEYLNLDRNALTNVDALSKFYGLKWLRLNGNRLSSLPPLQGGIKRIYLARNAFEEVPDTLRRLPALTDIDLSGNPVSAIPGWLAEKKGLEHLSLSGTRVKSLPADLSAWKSLKSLQLGDLDEMSEAERRRIRADLPGTAVVF